MKSFLSEKMEDMEDELPNFNIMKAFGLPVFTDEQATSEENNADQTSVPEGRLTVNKKIRFAELETGELDDIVKHSQAKQTKKATQWAVSVFTGLL